MVSQLRRYIKRGYLKTLRLLFYSSDSAHKIALGCALGLFWGLTPTVGLQITLLLLSSSLIFFLNKLTNGSFRILEFNFPLSVAFTWVSNPLNALPLYFLFYFCGTLVIPGAKVLSIQEFAELLSPLLEVDGFLGNLDHPGIWFKQLWQILVELGVGVVYPIILGSIVLAFPCALGAYGIARWFLSSFSIKGKRAAVKV